jgi:hypothetical protein
MFVSDGEKSFLTFPPGLLSVTPLGAPALLDHLQLAQNGIVQVDKSVDFIKSVGMGLDHPLDGITNPKYKLLHFITTKNSFAKIRRH